MRATGLSINRLIGCLLLCFAAAAIGSVVTLPAIGGWYRDLAKPDFNPPDWLFGPVWTLLYAMMAVALWRVIGLASGQRRRAAVLAFALQLLLNVAWSLVFFGAHSIGGGLATIILLWLAILATILRFSPIDSLAGWLLAPYLLWVSFAALLNLALLILN